MSAVLTLRRAGAVVLSLCLATGVAGCGTTAAVTTPATATGALAIVVGARSNMPAPVPAGKSSAALESALASQAYLAIVVADGQPFISGKAGKLLTRSSNSIIESRDRDANRQLVDVQLADARTKTAETDLLGALDTASRAISSQRRNHTIVVIDSGLSTVAPLDFRTPGLIDSDPAELATSLKTAGELPDLAGDDVTFQGLGDTARPQIELGRPRRANLIDIWVAIAKAAGARTVQVERSPLTAQPQNGLPFVSPVPLKREISCTGSVVTLTSGDVAFKPDSAVIKDRAAALAVVEPLAKELVGSHASAELTGTTANVGSESGQHSLSRERAQAVADVLESLGVPADRLSVNGLGSKFPGYVVDHDKSGNLLPSAAALNRKVILNLSAASVRTLC